MTALTDLRRRSVRALREVARPARALELARSGMVDLEYYEALTGLRFTSALQAARHYLGSAQDRGLSLHPLFEAEYLEPERPPGAEDAAVRYLRDPALFRKRSPHALFDLAGARRALGKGASSGRGGSWLAWVRVAGPETPVPVPAGESPIAWGELRAFLLDCAVEWRESRVRSSSPASATRLAHGAVTTWTTADGTNPVVSVAVRWDLPSELRPVLDAVLTQSYPHLEVLVVDDGSHADTAGVVAGVAAFDPRVRLVTSTDRGAAALLNAALRAATGEYLAFADSRFVWQPGFIADLIGTMAATEARFAYVPVTHPGRSNGRPPAGQVNADALLQQDLAPLGSVVVATGLVERVGGFDESLPGSVGHDLLLRLSQVETPRMVATGALAHAGESGHTADGDLQPAGWRACVQGKQLLDWTGAEDHPRHKGIVSVVVPVLGDLPGAVGWTRLVDGNDTLETVLVGLRSRAQYSVLRALARHRRVVVLSSPADTWALLCNLGGLASTGDRLVFVKAGTELDAGAVVAVARALDDPAVAVAQPINAQIDLTVSTAGAYFAPGNVVPSALLANHAMADAERLAPATLPGAYSSVIAVRTTDFIGLAGFDPVFANSLAEVDLSLRAQALGVGRTELVPAQVTARSQQKVGFPHDLATSAQALVERWSAPPTGSSACLEAAGFAVVGHRARQLGGGQPSARAAYLSQPELAPTRLTAGPHPTLRWAIDIAAPATWWGQRWGDRYFAYSLAAALRRLGQQVAVDHREARNRETRRFDDVVLTLRGIDSVFAVPGPLNLMWVISHPDEIGPDEAASYDRVFAASAQWARQRAADWGIAIEPLLQCTDTGIFAPQRGLPDTGPGVLFVGNARQGGSRPVIDYALAADIPVQIYGSDWERTKASDLVVAKLAPNAGLGQLYASAEVVLNDHWTDMARNGFISNRLFDAVACGARVLSDRVDGIAELFGDSVQFYESPADLAAVLARPRDAVWPSLAERSRTAERVRAEHSFDKRAAQLLASAVQALAERSRQGLQRR